VGGQLTKYRYTWSQKLMERVEGSAKLIGNQRASAFNGRFHFNARKKM
jgi:hypothetical protein